MMDDDDDDDDDGSLPIVVALPGKTQALAVFQHMCIYINVCILYLSNAYTHINIYLLSDCSLCISYT